MFFQKNLSKLLNLFLYLAVFLFSIYPYSDYDWGWHYRYGEHLLKTGSMLREDIYSWTLPGYQWINHSWLFDPLLYLIFQFGGFTGVMLIGALVGFLTYYISIRFFKLAFWHKIILALFYLELAWIVMSQSLRSQVLIMIFYPLLILILIFSQKNKNIIFLLPILFLVWVNFHGTFTIGLLIVALFLGVRFIIDYENERKYFFFYLGALICVFLATLINPYGYLPYFEAIKHLSSPLVTGVFEWMPLYDFINKIALDKQIVGYYFAFYILLFVYLFFKRKRLSDVPYGIIIAVLSYLTIKHNRYIGPLISVSLPIMALFLQDIRISLEKYKMFNLMIGIILIISLQLSWNRVKEFNLLSYNFKDYCQWSTRCSEKMARYLFDNPPKGKGFNFYDGAGYLIGRGIPLKLFIDGRMHLWEKDGYMPFVDYIKIYFGRDSETFRKYNFDWILLRNDSPLNEELVKPGVIYGMWEKAFADGEMILYIKK